MTPRLARFQDDFRLRFGEVDRRLGELVHDTGNLLVSRDAFVMQPNDRIALRYQRGCGVVCEHIEGVSRAEVSLWFNGFARGLIAWLNGLTVLHASAAARNDQVVAFTGPSGAGKSSLVAGLAGRGWSVLEDDALVLDWSGGEAIALSGRPELRLWSDTFDLVDLDRGDEVEHRSGKYSAPVKTSGKSGITFPLRDLVFLEFGDSGTAVDIIEMDARERLSAIANILFRDYLVADVIGRERYGKTVLQLVEGLDFKLLRRPRARDLFNRALDLVEGFSTETA